VGLCRLLSEVRIMLYTEVKVGIATGYGLDCEGSEFEFPVGERFVYSPRTSSIPVLGSNYPPMQWLPGIKRPRPTSPEQKNMWMYAFTPPYVFIANKQTNSVALSPRANYTD
jgi:hypothetical protein